jgi:tetraacyldisaccharide 4'-kinase
MKPPFFSRKLLLPLVPAYQLALLLREVGLRTGLERVRRLRFPVVSVGSLSAGGAGKTPLTIALAKALTERGLRVDVLSRGYGRRSQRPVRVDPNGTAEEFGDEPLLIARESGVPVYVAAQRYDAGLLAEAEDEQPADRRYFVSGHDLNRAVNAAKSTVALAPEGRLSKASVPTNVSVVHLLDDGFQHRQLARDIDILLLDSRDWRDGLLPAGNLREPLQAAHRASVIAIPAAGEGPDDSSELEAALRAWGWLRPVWRLHRKMEVPAADGSVVAFCGIARPEQFFAGLETAGLRIAAQVAFPDHHRYAADDIKRLVAVARKTGATVLITTEKDRVRLGKLAAFFPESLPLKTAGLRIEIEKQEEALVWLVERIGQPTTVNTSGRLLRK